MKLEQLGRMAKKARMAREVRIAKLARKDDSRGRWISHKSTELLFFFLSIIFFMVYAA